MRRIRVWHKLLVIFLILAIPLGGLSWLALDQQRRYLRIEQRRLVGLRYVGLLRDLAEQAAKHQAASVGTLSGDTSYQPALLVFRDRADDAVAAIGDMDEHLAGRLDIAKPSHRLQDHWEDVRAEHPFGTAEESAARHTQLLVDIGVLAARVAEQAHLTDSRNTTRHAVADVLAFQSLAQLEAVSQARALTVAAAQLKGPTPVQRAALLAQVGRIQAFHQALVRTIRAADENDGGLSDELSSCLVENTVACTTFGDQLTVGLRTEAVPATVLGAADKALATTLALNESAQEAAVQDTEEAIARAKRGMRWLLGIVLGGLALSLAVCVFLAQGLARQTTALAHTLDRAARGDLQTRARVITHDELGHLAVSLNGVLATVQHRNTVVPDPGDSLEAVAVLAREIHQAAEGDLTQEAQVTANSTGPIAGSFNYLIHQLRLVIAQVQGSAIRVGISTNQVEGWAVQLIQSGEEQKTRVDATAAGLADITASYRQVGANVATAYKAARDALTGIQRCGDTVRQVAQELNQSRKQVLDASRGLRRLANSAEEIRRVTRVLEDVAEWTGMLSLNATLHAAVGGNGALRSTVLAEVAERLSTRATDAVREMKELGALPGETAQATTVLDAVSHDLLNTALVLGQAGQLLLEIDGHCHDQAGHCNAISKVAGRYYREAQTLTSRVKENGEFLQRLVRLAQQAAVLTEAMKQSVDTIRTAAGAFRLPIDVDEDFGFVEQPGDSMVSTSNRTEAVVQVSRVAPDGSALLHDTADLSVAAPPSR